jgi:DNA-binding beta-propeller fold protein YncE
MAATQVVSRASGVAADVGTQLPFPFMINTGPWLAVDPVYDHVFVSGGPGTSSIVVLDFSGDIVATITGEPGASQMAVDPATHALYVALHDSNAISEINTQTLSETARFAAYAAPASLVIAGGQLWYSDTDEAAGGYVASMSLDGTALTEQLQLREPVLLTSGGPGADLLATADSADEPPTLSV